MSTNWGHKNGVTTNWGSSEGSNATSTAPGIPGSSVIESDVTVSTTWVNKLPDEISWGVENTLPQTQTTATDQFDLPDFSQTIPTGGALFFGDQYQHGISTNGTTLHFNAFQFDQNVEPNEHDVLFNFDDKFQIYNTGAVNIKPTTENPQGLSVGSIAYVNGELKILKEN
tara:strand:+ start:108 stop:617 length:510 start_codon:yes stop_codon:yes gene_type:complete